MIFLPEEEMPTKRREGRMSGDSDPVPKIAVGLFVAGGIAMAGGGIKESTIAILLGLVCIMVGVLVTNTSS